MVREIKFRARTIQGRQKWVYGDYFSQHKDGVTAHYIVEHPNGRDAGREVMWLIDSETLGQYAGSKDGQVTDIYEDDLVDIDEGHWNDCQDDGWNADNPLEHEGCAEHGHSI